MKNFVSKFLLFIFLLQLFAQIVFLNGVSSFNYVSTPAKVAIIPSTQNSQMNNAAPQSDQLNNKTNQQTNIAYSGNTTGSSSSIPSVQSVQSTQSTSSTTSNPPANIDYYKYKEDITLDYTKFSSSFYNYPLLLYITNANLATYAKSDGSDIAFFGTDGSLYSYRIVSYSSGNLQAWVNIPYVSSSSNTVFYMAYGNQSLSSYQNETAVWNSNYNTVLHLNETSGSTVYDATLNGNNGQRYGTSSTTGIVGTGQSFSGSSSSYITDTANPSGSLTISFWFKLATTFNPGSYPYPLTEVLLTKYIDDNTDMHVVIRGSDYSGGVGNIGSIIFKVENNGYLFYRGTSARIWYSNTWYNIVVTLNSNNWIYNQIYINGQASGNSYSGSGSGNLPSTNFVLGGGQLDTASNLVVSSSNYLNGVMDEFSVMTNVQSGSYIQTFYNNLNSPSGFVYSIGTQQNNFPTINQNQYVLGVTDSGKGHPVLWATLNNGWHHSTSSVTMKINSSISNTNYQMSFNGSYWVLSSFLPVYYMLYSYSVINATDGYGHYLPVASVIKNYNFSLDTVAPTVLNYGYSPTETANGTFWAQVTDTWGNISKVTLNVTKCDCYYPTATSAVLQMINNGTPSMYIVNNLIMGSNVNINFTVTIIDHAGNSMTTPSSFSYVANKAPYATYVNLTSQSFTANDNLYVNYTYNDYDKILESGTYFNWYLNGVLQPQFNYTNIIDKTYLQYGQNWSVQVFPSNGNLVGTPVSSGNYTLKRAIPLLTSLTISPTNPKTGNNLTLNWAYFEADNKSATLPVSYNVTWYINGANNNTFNNKTIINFAYTKFTQNWTAIVQVWSGYNYSIYYSTSTIIQDTAPIISILGSGFNTTSTIVPGTPFNITYTYFDADYQKLLPQNTYVLWYVNGTPDYKLTNLQTINSTNSVTGFWSYFLTISDGYLNSSTVLSKTLTIGTIVSYPPTASNVIISSATGTVASDLSLSYTYSGNRTESGTTIRWYQNGTLQAKLNDSKTVSHWLLKAGDFWNATVTPYDGVTWGANYTANITINNFIPIASSLTISSNIYTNTNISASFIPYDADNNTLTANITWYSLSYNLSTGGYTTNWLLRFNQIIQIFNSNSTQTISFNLSSTFTERMDKWYYNVSLYDSHAYSKLYNSSIITILNSLPTVTILSFNQTSNIRTTDTIQATINYNDLDGDAMTNYTIAWYKNFGNSPFVTYTVIGNFSKSIGLYLFSNMTSKGEYWFYTIQVSDGIGYSLIYKSVMNILIVNTPPILTNLTITPLNPLVTTDLTVNYLSYYFDADGDPQSGSLIYWYLNGNKQQYLTGLTTVPSSALVKNDNWTVSITPSDGSSYGLTYNVTVTIRNSPPVISLGTIQNYIGTSEFYTTNNLIAYYTVTDPNVGDTVAWYNITWYINGQYNSTLNNKTIISPAYTVKGETWEFIVQISDGTNTSNILSSNIITILDSAPVVTSAGLNPTVNITTNTTFQITYTYSDADNDNVSNYVNNFAINWYLYNPSKLNFTLQIGMTNSTHLFANETTAGQYWEYSIQVFDGELYSTLYTTSPVFIGYSLPVITYLNITSSANYTRAGSLGVYYTYSDSNVQNSIQHTNVTWYMNNTIQPLLSNSLTVSSSYLQRGQIWYYKLQISDGNVDPTTNLKVWSVINTSSTIVIANFIPVVSNAGFASSQYQNQNFIVQGQNLTLQYNFYDADNDPNMTIVHWYIDNQYMPQFDNLTTITGTNIQANKTWYYVVIPYDGINTGKSVTSSSEFIESKANISNYGVIYSTQMEGNFIFWAIVHDLLNENSLSVQFYIKLKNASVVLINANNNGTDWIGQYSITNLANFPNYLNTTMNINIKAQTQVGLVSIISEQSFASKIIDNSPPRVINVNYIFDNPNNPVNVTFKANIQEYGSGIKSVFLYYDFETETTNSSSSVSNSTTLFSKIMANANFTKVQMVAFNSTYYTITIPVDFKANTYILYKIQTEDNAGNINPNAYPLGLDKNRPDAIFTFKPNSGINLNDVIAIVLVVTVILIGISFVAIKKFRSTELVGLDKELVLSKIKDIKNDNEIITQLDLHTLGIIVSFFDQRHGPIPIIVTPDILNDNYNLLVDLSDMSFSSARFSGNFEDEIFSTYNFNPGPGQFINIISFGYALNRPSARGGAENITLNILIHKNVSELINQFIDKFQDKIHEIHIIMDKHGNDKDLITQKIKELRIYLSKIVVTYEKLYGTTELLDNYDEIFDKN